MAKTKTELPLLLNEEALTLIAQGNALAQAALSHQNLTISSGQGAHQARTAMRRRAARLLAAAAEIIAAEEPKDLHRLPKPPAPPAKEPPFRDQVSVA